MKTANGLSMLVAQAHRSAEIFLGERLNPSLIDTAIRRMQRAFQNVVLIGMPGCGKSTVASRIAERLGKTAVDTDKEIERVAQASIPTIFETEGEAAFREREAAVIRDIGKRSGLVIATGGGAVLRAENRAALRQNGVVIFLERELDDLATDGRPLSRDRAALERMYAERLPLYREVADVSIRVSGTPDDTCRLVEEVLKR